MIRSRGMVGKVCEEDTTAAKEITWDPCKQVRMHIVRLHPCSQVLDALFELESALIARTKVEV
jgi:hypothetical protein